MILTKKIQYLFVLSFQPVTTGWVGKSDFAMLPVRVYVFMSLACALSYVLLERTIIHSSGCEILRVAVSESRKEQWTLCVEALALGLSFIPGVHYAACPLLLVAMAPWIIPDLRMKRVFEQARRGIDKTEAGQD